MKKDKQLSLKEKYKSQISAQLGSELGITNFFAVPKLTKIVVNIGTGDLSKNKEAFAKLASELTAITGQKAKVQAARISIAGFNLREGMHVGLSSTLRGDRMYTFLEKLIRVVLPRLRDFRGVPSKSFDKGGNYTLGLSDHTVFPEIDLAKVDRPHGLEITIVSTSRNKEEGYLLLEKLGMPFEKGVEQ